MNAIRSHTSDGDFETAMAELPALRIEVAVAGHAALTTTAGSAFCRYCPDFGLWSKG